MTYTVLYNISKYKIRKKKNFIKNLKNSSKNKDFFIASTDVGEIWKSKNRIQNSKSYVIHLIKKEKLDNLEFKTTKDYTEKLLKKKKNQPIKSFSHC